MKVGCCHLVLFRIHNGTNGSACNFTVKIYIYICAICSTALPKPIVA